MSKLITLAQSIESKWKLGKDSFTSDRVGEALADDLSPDIDDVQDEIDHIELEIDAIWERIQTGKYNKEELREKLKLIKSLHEKLVNLIFLDRSTNEIRDQILNSNMADDQNALFDLDFAGPPSTVNRAEMANMKADQRAKIETVNALAREVGYLANIIMQKYRTVKPGGFLGFGGNYNNTVRALERAKKELQNASKGLDKFRLF